ncbi:hypothetical protein HPP92_006005 [Vanilla planifolia]|uniref:Uncharacterized protein n=1 Tax=Vanilla planifolia TaxID=51239 RepID=A0A835VFY1_VANPL|nr:hypothetical protein HPP92_006318 [Vanilla planifolia]KAG0495011.1 hypothetical protein HPP92_006005 [Vanilla planifolia]
MDYPFCPPNMLQKSFPLASIRVASRRGKFEIDEGSWEDEGDLPGRQQRRLLCPSLKLGEGDFSNAGKNFPLWDLIQAILIFTRPRSMNG